ncbi:hypothetical protein [Microvirga makkahensis]|uniref:Uncharacterized protein n=1 Tax=Microvirga makkahensis TaxID=1128670 RepID=A0A7X3MNI3_9HYPH|nr:hypothetical protein [Microvirga makkahensis]MXQ10238.1 hypothetical protein [Microvirga makkahensis]
MTPLRISWCALRGPGRSMADNVKDRICETMCNEQGTEEQILDLSIKWLEERIKQSAEHEKRSELVTALRAQGIIYSTIGIRLGMSSSTVSGIAREHSRQAHG